MESILNIKKILNNGIEIPMMGYGTWHTTDGEAAAAVRQAIEAGYRSIDTAAFYNCEKGVGQGIRDSGVPREELFITTKVWPSWVSRGKTLDSLDESLERLGLEYVDLWLMHWPVNYINGWADMEVAYREGRARAIGVSNMRVRHLLDLLDHTDTVPAYLQIECNPLVSQFEVRSLCAYRGIAVGGWQPLGYGANGELLSNAVMVKIAEEHGKTPAQVALRWAFQNDVITVPKTLRPERMAENANIMDFNLSAEDLERIGQLRQIPRYDTEIADVPARIRDQVEKNIRFKPAGYEGTLTPADFFKDHT